MKRKRKQGKPCFHYRDGFAVYHKWDVKNDFAYVLQFFSLISDSLGGVYTQRACFSSEMAISI